MSKRIDERVVSMKFDNAQFERDVSTSMSTLEKLKKSLDLKDASKGLENVSAAAKKFNLTDLTKNVKNVKKDFSSLENDTKNSFTKIGDSASSTGKSVAKALSVDASKMGLKEYESQVKSVKSSIDSIASDNSSKVVENANTTAKKVNDAVKKVDLSPLSKGIETVKVKFSAMQVAGVTAIANITNSAVNSGRKIVRALTIDPIRSGLQEYETQINAVQTIMANTSSKGTTLDEVNAALDELNVYADKTIYNFTEMTRNIGTFTAAGVDLHTATNAIQGISNLAAVAGSTSQQASTAMYQLSQAMAAGAVKLQDWNSVVNAGMGGEMFQNALKETSRELKTGVDAAIEDQGSFRESLKKGWLTAEVLTETLKKFTKTGANEYIAKYTGLTLEAVEAETKLIDGAEDEAAALDKAAEVLAKKSGKSKAEIKQALEFAKNAEDAATKVKTFTQLMDTMKESVQSGWSQTWKILIGDFEEAKTLWTSISDVFTGDKGFLTKMSNARNALLEKVMGNPFADLIKSVNGVTGATNAMNKATQDYGAIVKKVIGGEFGNGQKRFDALTKAGYDWAHVQNLVNEKMGDSTRHATKYTESQKDLNKTQAKTIDELLKLSDAELKNLKLKPDEIKALRELGKQSEKTGIPINELIKDMDQLSGRTLLFNSLKNIGHNIVTVFSSISKAWKEMIPALQASHIYDLIAGFHKFSVSIKLTDEDAEKLKRTFKGLFAIVDLIRVAVTGGLSIAFDILKGVLKHFDKDILDVTAYVGDLIVKFHDFLLENNSIIDGVKRLAIILSEAIVGLSKWIGELSKLPIVTKAVDKFKSGISELGKVGIWIADVFEKFTASLSECWAQFKLFLKELYKIPVVKKSIDGLKNGLSDFANIGKWMIEGFQNGIKDGVEKIPDSMVELGTKALNSIKDVLGIESPSKEMYAIGEFTVEGLVNGLKDGTMDIWTAVKGIGDKILTFFKELDWGKIFAGGISVGILVFVKKLFDLSDTVSKPLDSLSSVFSSTSRMIGTFTENMAEAMQSFTKVIKAQAMGIKAQALKDIAIAIGILVVAIIALTFFDPAKLWNAVGIIAVLGAVLTALSFAVSKISDSSVMISKGGIQIKSVVPKLIGIGLSLLLVAAAMKMMGSMNWEQMTQSFAGLAAIVGSFVAVILAFSLLKGKSAENFDKVGNTILKVSLALLLMVGVCKLAGKLTTDDLMNAISVVTIFGALIIALQIVSFLTSSGKGMDGLGSSMLKISVALAIMVIVCKLAGKLSQDDLINGAKVLGAFTAFILLLRLISLIPGSNMNQLGLTILLMSAALAKLVIVCKLAGKLERKDMINGGIVAAAFLVFVTLLVKATKIGKEEQIAKLGLTMIAMAVAVGILAGICVLLGMVDTAVLVKGAVAVGVLSFFMAGMIKAAKGVGDSKGTFIGMAAAIAVMAIAVAALSFIDPVSLYSAVGALSILMLVFSVVENQAKHVKGAMGAIIAMTVAIGLIGGIIFLLSKQPVTSVLASAGALSALLLSLGGSMALIGKFGKIGPMAMVSVGFMVLVLGALAFIMTKISGLPIESTRENVLTLSGLLLALSATLGVLTLIGLGGPAALIGIGSLAALIVGIGGLITAIGFLVTKFPQLEEFLNKGIPILEKIGYAIGSFFGNIVLGFGEAILGLLPALGLSLSQFMVNATPFIMGVKMVDETLLQKVGILTGAILALAAANFITAITQFLSFGQSFADLGFQLSSFIIGAMPFILMIRNVDPEAMKGAKALADTLLTLTTTNLLSGISSWLGISTDFSKFGEQLVAFGEAVVDFSSTVSGKIDSNAVTAAANAGKIMAEMQKETYGTGGILQWILGEKNLGDFGAQLKKYGECIVGFSDTVKGKIDTTAVEAAANAGKIMAELQKGTYGTGGVLQWIFGEKDLGDFGEDLKEYGVAIADFSSAVDGKVNTTAVEAAANAGKLMAELQKGTYGTGGVLQWFFGEKSMSTFGEQITDFGEAIVDFSSTVSGNINTEAVTAATNAGSLLSKLAESLPTDGSIWDIFSSKDKMDFEGFGEQIVSFGNAIVNFSSAVSGKIDGDSTSKVTDLTKKLISLFNEMKDLTTNGVGIFKDNVNNLKSADIKKVIELYTKENLSTAISNCDKIRKMMKNMNGIKNSDVDNFVSNISKLANSGIDKLISAFSDKEGKVNTLVSTLSRMINSMVDVIKKGSGRVKGAFENMITTAVLAFNAQKGKVKETASKLVDFATEGISSSGPNFTIIFNKIINDALTVMKNSAKGFGNATKEIVASINKELINANSSFKLTINSMLKQCVIHIKTHHSSFKQAGKWLGEGLTAGIKSKETAAYQAGYNLGKKAIQGEKDGQNSNSPSKDTIKAGKWLGEGLIIGIDNMGKAVYKSGKSIGQNAVNSISSVLGNVSNLVDSDIDIQPTIRPVVDMASINTSRLDVGASMDASITRPVNSLSEIISKSQSEINASNNRVISAIDKLRADINDLYSNEQEIALYVDSKKLASSLSKPMNRQLNILSTRGAY